MITDGQNGNCTFKPPVFTIHFGSGNVRDVNGSLVPNYRRVASSCPTDGHYSYTSQTSDCFRGDWFTLTADHTPGDVNGNMMLVNASYNSGIFLRTPVSGLKAGTTYEFAVWMMNVCKISDKCPFPLLPNISIQLVTSEGKKVTQLKIGEVPRRESPYWTQYKVIFDTPPSETALTLVMINHSPGGCGNDFALDDITFRECIKKPVVVPAVSKSPVPRKQPPATPKPVAKKPAPPPEQKQPTARQIEKPKIVAPQSSISVIKTGKRILAPTPPILRTRENELVKQITTEAGEIRIDLYDNGEIDGDTVSIYHNNVLIVSRQRLSLKPISFRIAINPEQPHHELVMVAENLGSIPPNTSLMVVSAGAKRYEVYISSNEQKNAKVIFDLKE